MMNSLFRLLFVLLLIQNSPLFAQKLNMEHLKGIEIRSIGPAAMSGRIVALAVRPDDPNTIYAGAASGGLWRSTGGGTGWQPIFDKAPTQAIGSIALNPKNPDEIWVGTGEGNPRNSQNFGKGVFKTIDGGKTWKAAGLENSRAIHRLILHRDNPEIAWAAVIGPATGPTAERGVFKTVDGGKTWRKTLFVNELTGCADLVVDPQNPQKLVAAMWEYERKPWFFNSGGKGSGLHVSFDGGETWERRTDKDGLPEGNLGRIGLAIAPSNPKVIYALVEAKENALFRSTDGGFKWSKMGTKGIGDRPFYYSEIYVDPSDEMRVYTIFTTINKSEDGGKTFEQFAGWNIHPDHHAFWISPTDPDFIINGNDGGLNITHDRGKTWHFAENLPIGQFYHVNIDNDLPYNLYGGLQDNGTWVGPSSVWKAGGIRNSDWREVLFGDGFDCFPRPSNNRFLYATSQGGHIAYVDKMTGESPGIQPVHPEGKKLRFNWNAGMAQDPFHDCGLYMGSQFLHKSMDCGQSWQVISPDLSTNDTSKMHQDISGGLTFDATNAENHCTIIALAPSTLDAKTVWVGTDDGQIQLTRDGGATWENCSKNLPGCPPNAWIPQIELSTKNAGEAWVVVNNYRQNDWKPYVFKTSDFGKTWRNMANSSEIGSYVLSILPDPVEPNLVFLGADDGLYFSINGGQNWQKWTANDFPSVNVMDMKIQERDADLVLGTFGRAFQIMDNLRPLREIARTGAKVLDQPFKIFQPGDAILASWRSVDGPRFATNDTWSGQNERTDAKIPIWVKPVKKDLSKKEGNDKKDDKKGASKKEDDDKKEASKKEKDDKKAVVQKEDESKMESPKKDEPKMDEAKTDSKIADSDSKPAEKDKKKGDSKEKDKATVHIFNERGDTIRTLKWKLDTGLTNWYWGLEQRGVRMPSNDDPKPDDGEPGGPNVLPGNYKLKITWQEWTDSTTVRVLPDPRIDESMAQKEARLAAQLDFNKQIGRASKAYERLREVEKNIKLIEDSWQNVPDSLKKDLLKSAGVLKDSISAMKKMFMQQGEVKGIQRNSEVLTAKIWEARGRIEEARGAPGQNASFAVGVAQKAIDEAVQKVNSFVEKDWADWQAKAGALPFSLFKEFKKID